MSSLFSNIDIALLKKYDKPGPRYTSYPTAPLFSSDYTPQMFKDDITHNNIDSQTPLSLYVHIPFCDTLCYFCGCTTIITPNTEHLKKYIGYLEKEIDSVLKRISKKRSVVQLHWGGGTPSYLQPEQIRKLGNFIRERADYADNIEYGVEIDPRGLTLEHLQAFREAGMNRVSIGVQDFNGEVQESSNRIQPEETTMDAIIWARNLGIKSINIDLIYGLPKQTKKTFEITLDKAIRISPERFAIFNFAYIPWLKPHQKLINQNDLPTPDEKLEILKMTIEKLVTAGYLYIGMDHFVKPSDEMAIAQKNKTLYRNFQGYSTNAQADLFGFGMSSISHFGTVYSQNHKTLDEYYKSVGSGEYPIHLGYRMNQDDIIRKDIIMKLMCDLELNKKQIEDKFNIVFKEYFTESLLDLQIFVDEGIVENSPDHILIKGMGRLVLRNIAMCFDAYIKKMVKEKPIFSRTV